MAKLYLFSKELLPLVHDGEQLDAEEAMMPLKTKWLQIVSVLAKNTFHEMKFGDVISLFDKQTRIENELDNEGYLFVDRDNKTLLNLYTGVSDYGDLPPELCIWGDDATWKETNHWEHLFGQQMNLWFDPHRFWNELKTSLRVGMFPIHDQVFRNFAIAFENLDDNEYFEKLPHHVPVAYMTFKHKGKTYTIRSFSERHEEKIRRLLEDKSGGTLKDLKHIKQAMQRMAYADLNVLENLFQFPDKSTLSNRDLMWFGRHCTDDYTLEKQDRSSSTVFLVDLFQTKKLAVSAPRRTSKWRGASASSSSTTGADRLPRQPNNSSGIAKTIPTHSMLTRRHREILEQPLPSNINDLLKVSTKDAGASKAKQASVRKRLQNPSTSINSTVAKPLRENQKSVQVKQATSKDISVWRNPSSDTIPLNKALFYKIVSVAPKQLANHKYRLCKNCHDAVATKAYFGDKAKGPIWCAECAPEDDE